MSKPTGPLTFAGASISHPVRDVEIVLLCVRPDESYRVSVRYLSSGFEIDELSKSYPTENEARSVARGYCRVFYVAVRVQDVLDVLAELDRLAVAA